MKIVDQLLNGLNYQLIPARCACCQGPGQWQLDLCAACQAELPPPPPVLETAYGRVFAGSTFATPLDTWIHAFKFQQDLLMGRLLARLCAPKAEADMPLQLLPVPLHRKRLRTRGFNQALELARFWGRQHGIAVPAKALARCRETAVQSQLDAQARRLNVQGAFSARAGLPAHVALVDDVYTTGATCAAAAEALQQAGVTRVDVWCLARVL